MKELSKQRDLAQAKLEDALREIRNGRASRQQVYKSPLCRVLELNVTATTVKFLFYFICSGWAR